MNGESNAKRVVRRVWQSAAALMVVLAAQQGWTRFDEDPLVDIVYVEHKPVAKDGWIDVSDGWSCREDIAGMAECRARIDGRRDMVGVSPLPKRSRLPKSMQKKELLVAEAAP